MSASKDSLPELPEAKDFADAGSAERYSDIVEAYTFPQIRAYGLACYQAGLERAAVICETKADDNWSIDWDISTIDAHIVLDEAAAAIRSEKQK